jgi:hypothetical protein
MTDKMQVEEHLRNGALYRPVSESSLSGEWKRKLFYQHALHQQLKNALQEGDPLPKWFFCIGVPIICVTLAVVTYFGFAHPEHWYESIVPIVNFDFLNIGLNEVLVFVATVNGLTLLVRRRAFLL